MSGERILLKLLLGREMELSEEEKDLLIRVFSKILKEKLVDIDMDEIIEIIENIDIAPETSKGQKGIYCETCGRVMVLAPKTKIMY